MSDVRYEDFVVNDSPFLSMNTVQIPEPFLVMPQSDIVKLGKVGAVKLAIKKKYGCDVTDEFVGDFINFARGQ